MPLSGDDTSLWGGLLTSALALAFVVALAVLVLRGLRRWSGGRLSAAAPLKVLHVHSLGPRERLVLVRHRGNDLLLGVTPGAITLVDRHPAAPEAADRPSTPTRVDPGIDPS